MDWAVPAQIPPERNNLMKAIPCVRVVIPLAVCVFCLNEIRALADPPLAPQADGKEHRRQHLELRQRAAEAEYRKRAYPLAEIPPGAMARAMAQIQQAKPHGLPAGFSTNFVWYNLGPAPMNSPWGFFSEQFSGRISAVAVDPSNPGYHWLIGGAQGGVWETTNQGGTWLPRTDDQASLAMGAITFAPSKPSVVYEGTGEPNFSGDSYAGAGLLVSGDGGTTWRMLNTNFAQTSFSSIRVDTTNQNRIAVATVRGIMGIEAHDTNIPPTAPPRGVFVSTNGGTNFTRSLTGEATDLVMDPNHFTRQYAALGEVFGAATNGVYRTTNGWTNASLINGPWMSADATNLGRIALAISPVTTGTIYVGVTSNANTGGLAGIWRTDDAWDATPVWTNLPNPDTGNFLWYFWGLSVDPNDYTSLYLAEYNLWHYSSGTWTAISTNIHSDNHVMAWVPQGFNLYDLLLGNDGGIWLSPNPGSTTWYSLNGGGLSISQMYKGAVHPRTSVALALAETQDNGTAAYTGSMTWSNFLGGDGCDTAISASNPDTDWAASWETYPSDDGTYIHIYRTQNAGQFVDLEATGIDTNDAPFFVHFEKAPFNDDYFIAGTVRLWLATNFFSGTWVQWNTNSPIMFDTNGAPEPISAVAWAPSDTNGLTYAFATEDGQMRITTSGGTNWNDANVLNAVPRRYITGMAFSPANPDVLYVALSGFDEGTPGQPGHVFETMNARAASPAWINVSPPVDLPMDCLVIDPTNANNIFAGSDIGVWVSTNAGAGWTHLGPETGMPNVAVYDLRMDSLSMVTAFTHGRGAFKYAQARTPILVVDGPIRPVDIACDGCPGRNWVNPGDLVSIEFPLINTLPSDTVNLTATMMATAQVTPMTGTQSYGVVTGQGAPVSRKFSFILTGAAGGPGPSTCGSTVPVTLQLADQGVNLGQVTVPFRLGVPSHPLQEEFDELTVPNLPPNWQTTFIGSGIPWMSTSNSPPNDASADDPDESEEVNDQAPPPVSTNICVFAPALPGVGQSSLTTAPFAVATSQAQVNFRQAFIVSNAYDGCILEIAIGAQPFQDIVHAGGSFGLNGYNVTLKDNNPLGPVRGWSGNSGGWLPTLVNLPATAAGQSMQLRWHLATSRGLTNGGWFVDSVAVTEPLCEPPVSNPVISNTGLNGTNFTFAIPGTVSGRTYVLEYKTNLTDAAWTFYANLPGNGSNQRVNVPVSPDRQRFYRFHLQ